MASIFRLYLMSNLENLKMPQCDLLQPQIGVLGMRGNMGKATLWKAIYNHCFLGSGGIVIIGLTLNAESMEQQKYIQWVTSFWSLGKYLIVNVEVLKLEYLATLNDLNFEGMVGLTASLESIYICYDDLWKMRGFQTLRTLRVAKMVEALYNLESSLSMLECVELRKEISLIVISNCPPFYDERIVIGLGRFKDLHLILALADLQMLNINWCLQLRAMPNFLHGFRGLLDLIDCPAFEGGMEIWDLEILLGLRKLPLKGIQIKERFGIGNLGLCKLQCPLENISMSDRISVTTNFKTLLHSLDCLALEEVVAVENVSLALHKLHLKRIGMSKWVNVGEFTDMFEVAPCEQHELLSDILSFPSLNCIDMTQYHSITMLYLQDLESEDMDLMNLALTYFCTWDIHWPLNFRTMARLDQNYQLLFKWRTLASDGALEVEHCLLASRKLHLKGVMDVKMRLEHVQKNANKLSMEHENRIFDWEQRWKGDVDKRMVQMVEFHHQSSQVFKVSSILSNFESNSLECCVTLVIERLVHFLELETRSSKSQRSDSKFFKLTKLKDNINRDILEGHDIRMEQGLIGIMIEYMRQLHEAIIIVLQIVQGILYLYEEGVCHCDFQIPNGFITHALSLSLAKDYVHVNLANIGLWKATYSNHSSNTNMGAFIYLAIELVARKNLMYFEINKSMVPFHPSICVIKVFMRIMSDYEGKPMSLPNGCPPILVLMTTGWWSITPIDQLDLFILLEQLKNLMQSAPMACFVDHKSSHYMIIERLQIVFAYSSGQMLQNVIAINENEIDCHSLEGKWTQKLNALRLAGIKDEMFLDKPSQPIVKSIEGQSWTSLPMDIHEALLNKLTHEDLCQMKLVSKALKEIIESDTYHASRGEACQSEASLSSLYFFIKHGAWQCAGFDSISQKWRRLPPLTCLPPPDEDLFKEYLVAGSNGLLCINVSKLPHEERLIVCNPLTQKKMELPPLRLRRNPVLLHIMVNAITNSYKVIVAGSSGMEGGGLSKCTEVFDSLTWQWTRTGDIPGPEFCLNEYQTGVCINNILYCIAFVDDGSGKAVSGKGVLAYDVNEGMWMPHWKCLLPSPTQHHTNSIAQLLECNGELYLFLEREHGRHVDHCIEKLEGLFSNENVVGNWSNIMKESKTGGRGLLVYPEFTCVPHGDKNICIFNTIEHKGVVHDIIHGQKVKKIQPPPVHLGDRFHSLNPLSFIFHPNFMIKPTTCKT